MAADRSDRPSLPAFAWPPAWHAEPPLSARDGPLPPHQDAEAAPLPADPTLGGGVDVVEPLAPVFPDTAEGAHLVLYQTADGGVDVRWSLDPAAIKHARAAFTQGGDAPVPVLRLSRLDAAGAAELIADAPLDNARLGLQGLAHYGAAGISGSLRAEIGFHTPGGGWVLVARSNSLQAVTPVGAAFLREPPSGAAPPPPPVARQVAPAPEPLLPEFPLVPPVMSGAVEARGPLSDDLDAARPVPAPGLGTGGGPADNRVERGGERGGTGPAAAPAAVFQQAPPLDGLDARSADAGVGAATGAEPGPGGEPGSAAAQGQPGRPVAGSGPIRPVPADAACTLRAELVVYGSAPPGTVLDLGGHGYQVGSGGRFSLRLPVQDRELILTLLAALPDLPVESRDAAPSAPRD